MICQILIQGEGHKEAIVSPLWLEAGLSLAVDSVVRYPSICLHGWQHPAVESESRLEFGLRLLLLETSAWES